MIISCPACDTRYEVPESSIPPQGRTVRCANCRHSWFEARQDDEADPAEAEAVAEPEAVHEQPTGEPVAYFDDTATEPPVAAEDAGSPTRGSRTRLWAWAAVIFIVLAGATVAATRAWGVPDWVPVQRSAFAAAPSSLRLEFPPSQQERRQLPNGTEFFGASGTITNVDDRSQAVPPILIVLRDDRDRIVYSWEVAPPKRSLAPGETITVNEAIIDVPRSARVAEIGWKPG